MCQHASFRGPTLSGSVRASPERGHAALRGLEGSDREGKKDTQANKDA